MASVATANKRSRRWRTHVFGLALDGSFVIAGCPPGAVPDGLPRVSMELAGGADLRARMPSGSAVVSWRYGLAGAREPQFVGHRRAGYLVDAPGFGVFHISSGGRHIRCAPAPVARWRWQRYLVGQVLPFASTLGGFEPWHASAVALPDGAIALVGDSGAGKSTLAAELMLAGATLLADDVVALAPSAPGVVVHPGPGLMSLRRPTVERLGAEKLRTLGTRVGGDEGSIRLAIRRCEQAMPLSTVYLLEAASAGEPVCLTPVPDPDPTRLLGSTFNFALSEPRRLVRQLDVCAEIARSVRIVRVSIPADVDHAALAQRLLARADGTEPARR